ncbi:hypothetical protein LSAT2_000936 [Lamellibrachia satsuma]|nr:hypothetical protein LSAT2_000936 [Lamellibrachia satsuma]
MAVAVNVHFVLEIRSGGVSVQPVARVSVHFAQNREEALDFGVAVRERQEWYHDPETSSKKKIPTRHGRLGDLACPPVERWRHHSTPENPRTPLSDVRR